MNPRIKKALMKGIYATAMQALEEVIDILNTKLNNQTMVVSFHTNNKEYDYEKRRCSKSLPEALYIRRF